MGGRYAACLDYLSYSYDCYDYYDWHVACDNDHQYVIIASPTDCHYENLKSFRHSKTHILCEKPIVKDLAQLREVLSWELNLTMVNQYKYLADPESEGETKYNYFKTSNDGLEWDCINIIGLAKQKPVIKNSLPFWTCIINGRQVDLNEMDGAYVEMIRTWIKDPTRNTEYILNTHKRVVEGFYVSSDNWHTSKN